MAISRLYTFVDGVVPTAAQINGEINNIINNALSLISPVTGSLDLDGNSLIFDAAGVTSIASPATRGFTIVPGAKSGTPSATGMIADVAAATYTDNATAGSGTATLWTGVSIQRPTLAATNTSVTTTDATTVYIINTPAAGTNQTLSNAWALWVDAGNVRFDDDIYWRSGTAFNGIFAHAISASRTWTFPDNDGTVLTTGNGAATQAEQEAASITTAYVTPGRQQYHNSAAKGWVKIENTGGAPSALASYNLTSLTDTGTGQVGVVWATDFSDANYVAIATELGDNNGWCTFDTQAAGSINLVTRNSAGAAADNDAMVVAFGDF